MHEMRHPVCLGKAQVRGENILQEERALTQQRHRAGLSSALRRSSWIAARFEAARMRNMTDLFVISL